MAYSLQGLRSLMLLAIFLLQPNQCIGFVSPIVRQQLQQQGSLLFKSKKGGPSSGEDKKATKSTDDTIKSLVKNLFSVCVHIQNPDLYSPSWADHAVLGETKNGNTRLVTSDPVKRGSIVSLHPLDALGLKSTKRKRKRLKKTMKQREETRDFLVFDQDRDGPYFQTMLSQSLQKSSPIISDFRIPVSLSVVTDDDQQLHHHELFTDINPTRRNVLQESDPSPGWMGHLASKTMEVAQANCVVVPLMAPLSALVATEDLSEGRELVCLAQELLPPEVSQPYSAHIQAHYPTELQELAGYLAMAFQPLPLEPVVPKNDVAKKEIQATTTTDKFQSPFYTINLDYPGIRYAHRNPDVLIIDNFLTQKECDRITSHAKEHMIPCVIKDPDSGVVTEDPSRTSTNANLPQSDVPSIVEKILQLTQAPNASYLETLQILRYTQGQTFYPHTDGFQGPTTACGFEESGRLVTIFCYLNDVGHGGETRFPHLELSIAPRKGMAVLHFPATTGLEEDARTEHEGSIAMDEKWLLVTWMWAHARTDPQYAENVFPSILP